MARTPSSFSLTQMWTVGLMELRSSSVASDTPNRAGASLGRANIGAPQRAQDNRSMRGDEGQHVVSPLKSISSARKIARAKNGPPVAFWQSRQ
jgi:hypothetical protein